MDLGRIELRNRHPSGASDFHPCGRRKAPELIETAKTYHEVLVGVPSPPGPIQR